MIVPKDLKISIQFGHRNEMFTIKPEAAKRIYIRARTEIRTSLLCAISSLGSVCWLEWKHSNFWLDFFTVVGLVNLLNGVWQWARFDKALRFQARKLLRKEGVKALVDVDVE